MFCLNNRQIKDFNVYTMVWTMVNVILVLCLCRTQGQLHGSVNSYGEAISPPLFPYLTLPDPACITFTGDGINVQDQLQQIFCQAIQFFPSYCRRYCGLCSSCEDLHPHCTEIRNCILCATKGQTNTWKCDDQCKSVNVSFPDEASMTEVDTMVQSNKNSFSQLLITSAMNVANPACTVEQPERPLTIREIYCKYADGDVFARYCMKFCGLCEGCSDLYPNCEDLALSHICTKYHSIPSLVECQNCSLVHLQYPDEDIELLLGCFPASSTVLTSTGKVKFMSEVFVGDKLLSLTRDGGLVYSDVYALLHYNHRSYTKYYTLETSFGEKITLSPEHFVYVLEQNSTSPTPGFTQIKLAEHVQVGDLVSVVRVNPTVVSVGLQARMMIDSGDDHTLRQTATIMASRVVAKTVDYKQGLFAPMTLEGTVVVDGIVASCYVVSDDLMVWEILMSPLRLVYHLQSTVWLWIERLLSYMPSYFDQCFIRNSLPVKGTRDRGLHWYAELLMPFAPSIQQWRGMSDRNKN